MERQGLSTILHSAESSSRKNSSTNATSTTMIILNNCRESQSMIRMSYARRIKKTEEESELCKKDKEDGGGELARSLVKLKPIDITRLTLSFAENAHIACDHVLRHGIKWGQKMIHTGRIIDLNTHAELLDMSHSSMEAMLTSDNITGNGNYFLPAAHCLNERTCR
jgi:hypothetical protein